MALPSKDASLHWGLVQKVQIKLGEKLSTGVRHYCVLQVIPCLKQHHRIIISPWVFLSNVLNTTPHLWY